MNAVAPPLSKLQIPFTEIQFELSIVDKKIIAVAIASLAFFGLQFAFSWPMTLLFTFVNVTLTYLSENYLRTEKNDWFNFDFDKERLLVLTAFIFFRTLAIQIACSFFGVSLLVPQEGLKQLILKQPLRLLFLASLVGPFAEEILFRGFLTERIEDAVTILNKFELTKISDGAKEIIADIAQAIIFGAVHLNQKIQEGMKIPLWYGLTFLGFSMAMIKRNEKSLITPITLHASNNFVQVSQIYLNV